MYTGSVWGSRKIPIYITMSWRYRVYSVSGGIEVCILVKKLAWVNSMMWPPKDGKAILGWITRRNIQNEEQNILNISELYTE